MDTLISRKYYSETEQDQTFMTTTWGLLVGLMLTATSISAQPKTATLPAGSVLPPATTSAMSKADLGQFPYVKTLPNFSASDSDSLTLEENRTYFFDGKAFLTIDGQVSAQTLTVKDNKKKIPSEFQIIQEFDKVVSTLGGQKVFTGKLPEEALTKLAGHNMVELGASHQVAPSAYYGVVEYVIKTPVKEVWLQLVPGTIGSKFYSLLVVEKQTKLLSLNTNKENVLLRALEKTGKTSTYLDYELDQDALLSQSKDELLNLVGIFQAHPDWQLHLEVNSAPVGKPAYSLSLTEQDRKSVV